MSRGLAISSVTGQRVGLQALAGGALAAAALVVPLVVNPYYVKVVSVALLYAYLASSWNVIGGYGGQLSLGHALFFGLGSYAVALAARAGWPVAFGALSGALVAATSALLVGAVCFRFGLRGIFFSVGTLLVAEVARHVALNSPLLGESSGLTIPGGRGVGDLQFTGNVPYYYMALAMLAGVLALVGRLERSRLGFGLLAVREDEASAAALGINVPRAKLIGLVLSAVLTAFGGAYHALLIDYVEPQQDLSLSLTLIMVMGAILGGRATLWGPVLGGVVVLAIQEILSLFAMFIGLSSVAALAQVVYGIFFVLAVLYFPQGLLARKPVHGTVSPEYLTQRLGGNQYASARSTRPR